MATQQDYYDILGVSKTATADDIKKAYRKKAMEYHPDRNPGNKEAEQKFKDAAEAYNVLSDSQKKAAYDKFGHSAFQQGGSGRGGGFEGFSGFGGGNGGFNFDINDIFEQFGDIFGGFGGGGGKQQQKKRSSVVAEDGADLRYDITITLKEAFTGTNMDISFVAPIVCSECNGSGVEKGGKAEVCPECKGSGHVRTQRGMFIMESTCSKCRGSGEIIKNPCKKCNGRGKIDGKRDLKIKIPAGIQDGNRIRINGEGEVGIKGGTNGDLYVFVSIKKDAFWDRKGDDLYCSVPVLLTTAILGGEISIPMIDDISTQVKIKEGTQSGEKIRIKDKGMTVLNSGGRRGDVIVNLDIKIPFPSGDDEKKLYLELDKILKEKENNKDSGFFKKWFSGGN
ncbi:MAG: molecular chaperone DnaJ [Rickettsiales bacterium]|jgi:molecular chaperone DnaJ|nr:molecular chaperone DnaJ [Rickettsiales bacterium]